MVSARRAPRILNRLPAPSEADILRQVRDYLRLKGWYIIRIQQSLGAHKGISDLIAVKAGKECPACGRRGDVLFIEVKAKTGQLSTFQRVFQQEIESQGGRYVVVRCAEDIMAVIREAERP